MWNNLTPKAPASQQSPRKFRRRQRVRYVQKNPSTGPYSLHMQTGTVLNPENWYNSHTGDRYVTVRLDSQQPFERGYSLREDELELETTGETQFEKRRYDLRFLSHQAIADFGAAVRESSTLSDERKKALLSVLPDLPS